MQLSEAIFIFLIRKQKWHFVVDHNEYPSYFLYRYFMYLSWFEFKLCLKSQLFEA